MEKLRAKLEERKSNCKGLEEDFQTILNEVNEMIEGCNLQDKKIAMIDFKVEEFFQFEGWQIVNYDGEHEEQGYLVIKNGKICLVVYIYNEFKKTVKIDDVFSFDVKMTVEAVKKMFDYLSNLTSFADEKSTFENILECFNK